MRCGLACAEALEPAAAKAPTEGAAMPAARNSRRPSVASEEQQLQRPNRCRAWLMVSSRDALSLKDQRSERPAPASVTARLARIAVRGQASGTCAPTQYRRREVETRRRSLY